jgi:hypothetical protein
LYDEVVFQAIIPGGNVGMSNKSEASRQTTATEDSLRLLIDTTPAFIHTALPDGALDFLNQGWLEFVGLPLTFQFTLPADDGN